VEDLDEILASLNARRTVLDGEAQFRFKVGDPVRFDAGRRGTVSGTVKEFKRGGKVLVSSGSGVWTVSGSLLRSP